MTKLPELSAIGVYNVETRWDIHTPWIVYRGCLSFNRAVHLVHIHSHASWASTDKMRIHPVTDIVDDYVGQMCHSRRFKDAQGTV